MTAALEGGEWSAARPDRTLLPEKTRYPFYRRLGGPQGRPGRVENLFPTGIRSRTVQPVVSLYTDWSTRSTVWSIYLLIMTDTLLLRPSLHSTSVRFNQLHMIMCISLLQQHPAILVHTSVPSHNRSTVFWADIIAWLINSQAWHKSKVSPLSL